MKNNIIIYTDGACHGNPGPGGWGVVILNDDIKKNIEISGNSPATTNNIMELTAAIKGLEYFTTRQKITLYTDSNYMKLGITNWINIWKTNKWLNSKRKSVKNKDLWLKLDYLNNFHNIDWKWVKAHDGNVYNERADYLATNAILN